MTRSEMVKLADAGMTRRDIAAMSGVPLGTVRVWIWRERQKPGRKFRIARVPDDHVTKIGQMARDGVLIKEMEAQTGIPIGTIATVMRRLRKEGVIDYRVPRAGRHE